mgnify:CR=1 FL=1
MKTQKQKTIIIVLGIIVLLLIIFGHKLVRRYQAPAQITIWGTEMSQEVFSELWNTMEPSLKNVVVTYVEKNPNTYQDDLERAFIDGNSPDIFMIKNYDLGVYKNLITPYDLLNNSQYSLKQLRDDFPTTLEEDLVWDNKLYGLPLSLDNLALYYNRTILDQLNIPTPPKTWEEIISWLPQLRTVDQYQRITRAAIPLGLASNINHFDDILSLIMMQYGAKMTNNTKTGVDFNITSYLQAQSIVPGVEALKFYAQFAMPSSKLYTWHNGFSSSLDAFAFGQSVLYLGYSKDRKAILEKNPNINFGISAFPQFLYSPNKLSFASYDALTVSSQSKHPDIAWNIIKNLTSYTSALKYMQLTKNPPALRSLLNLCYQDPDLVTFCQQALISHNWYRPDSQKVKLIFQEMINDVTIKNINPREAVNKAASAINALFQITK